MLHTKMSNRIRKPIPETGWTRRIGPQRERRQTNQPTDVVSIHRMTHITTGTSFVLPSHHLLNVRAGYEPQGQGKGHSTASKTSETTPARNKVTLRTIKTPLFLTEQHVSC